MSKQTIKKINYPAKVLLAWKEAISGNVELRKYLLKSKYKELGVFCFALMNDEKIPIKIIRSVIAGHFILAYIIYLLVSRHHSSHHLVGLIENVHSVVYKFD